MKSLYLYLLMFIISHSFLYSQNEVKIGNQIWMKKNLDVGKFRNGDPIQEVKSEEDWIRADSLKFPAWCYVDFDSETNKTYGKLYNWYAVNDPRGLAPAGWRIPNKQDWINLIDVANKKYTPIDTSEVPTFGGISCDNCSSIDSLTYSPKGYDFVFMSSFWPTEEDDTRKGRDSTGFSGVPAGYYNGGSKHMNSGFYGYWWSISEVYKNSSNAWGYELGNSYLMCTNSIEDEIARGSRSSYIDENGVLDKKAYTEEFNGIKDAAGTPKSNCLSVRCIKD
jgi:uncharacterized protein (TIGR02145 family)